MLQNILNRFSGLGMTILSGIFLAVSLVLSLLGISLPVDPVWGSIILSGAPLLYNAVTKLFLHGKITSSLLISIAMIAAIIIGESFAAGEVAFIMAIGGILEDRTADRAKKGIQQLINLAPRQGRRIRNGSEELIDIQEIEKGDLLRVLPGETIPVDGEIVEGNTSLDQSVMTGESLPVDKGVGDVVYSGTINRFGSIDMKAVKVGEDSSLQKLIRMVKDAENNKAPMQRIVDKWAAWLVPLALVIAVITYFLTADIIRAVTVLVVFCPCALALATPTSIMAAIGQATKHGVLIKSGEALEKMGQVDYVSFDKTGTLTHGKLEVSDIIPLDERVSEDELLTLTASLESRSEHPLGKAVIAKAREKDMTLKEVSAFSMIPGKGISAEMEGKTLLCGNVSYLEENGVLINDSISSPLEALRRQGKATLLLSMEKHCLGIIALSDKMREGAAQMIHELRQASVHPVLLTGDHLQTAEYFAAAAGIQDIHAELLPDQKVKEVERMREQGHTVCMIGDGVNDAPALKTADVGIAMGTMGSDIAVEAADIALIGEDLSRIPYLKRLSNATIKTIKFNITLAMVINFVAIALSIKGVLNPVTGALVHNIGSVLVVLNAALLYDRKFEQKKP